MVNTTIQMRKKGGFTLPAELREKYGVAEGDVFTVIDMGDGSFMLTPRVSQVNQLGARVSEALAAYNISPEDLISALDEEREQYYKEHYAKD